MTKIGFLNFPRCCISLISLGLAGFELERDSFLHFSISPVHRYNGTFGAPSTLCQ